MNEKIKEPQGIEKELMDWANDPFSSANLSEFETWWMGWAFRNSRPRAKRNYTLGQAVRAAWDAGFAAGKE